jgi:N-acetylglucosamine kinase-like BadF-type ATPase
MTSPAPSLVLAVDGGGTKTDLAVADRTGAIVFRGSAVSTNPMDNDGWRAELDRLFCSAAPLLPRVTHAVFGLPGFGEVVRFDALMLSAAAELFPASHRVMNDVELALAGAFLDGGGVLLLAGTGSMAMTRNAAGDVLRVGGWGEVFGDEGSAFWIGRRALAESSRAFDGRLDATGFARGILTGLGLAADGGNPALLGWLYGTGHMRSAVAGVARIVDALARSGDPTAAAILARAAVHLGAHMAAILHRANAGPATPWSFAGSVFESRAIRDALAARHGAPVPPRLPPIGGGLWRAARDAGWTTDAAWVATLAASIRTTGPAWPEPGGETGTAKSSPGLH